MGEPEGMALEKEVIGFIGTDTVSDGVTVDSIVGIAVQKEIGSKRKMQALCPSMEPRSRSRDRTGTDLKASRWESHSETPWEMRSVQPMGSLYRRFSANTLSVTHSLALHQSKWAPT